MWDWPVVVWCAIGAALMAAFYLIFWNLRRFNAWLGHGKKPRDRVAAIVVMTAVMGAISGGLWSSLLTDLRPCHDAGEPLPKCLFKPS